MLVLVGPEFVEFVSWEGDKQGPVMEGGG